MPDLDRNSRLCSACLAAHAIHTYTDIYIHTYVRYIHTCIHAHMHTHTNDVKAKVERHTHTCIVHI